MSDNNDRYDLLLGENIDNLNIEKPFNVNKSDNRVSYFFFEKPLDYFNNTANSIFFYFDSKENITNVSLDLNALVDKTFYNSFVEIYGEPTHIVVPDEIIYDNTPVKIKNAYIKRTAHKTREGTFEENPTFIIWKKENYTIQILMKYDQNISEIMFSHN